MNQRKNSGPPPQSIVSDPIYCPGLLGAIPLFVPQINVDSGVNYSIRHAISDRLKLHTPPGSLSNISPSTGQVKPQCEGTGNLRKGILVSSGTIVSSNSSPLQLRELLFLLKAVL